MKHSRAVAVNICYIPTVKRKGSMDCNQPLMRSNQHLILFLFILL